MEPSKWPRRGISLLVSNPVSRCPQKEKAAACFRRKWGRSLRQGHTHPSLASKIKQNKAGRSRLLSLHKQHI